MVELNNEVNQRKPFSGMRVLIAVAIGAGLGLAVAYFLKVLIDNSPAEIALGRLRLFYLMVLGGFAIETCSAADGDPIIRGQASPTAEIDLMRCVSCRPVFLKKRMDFVFIKAEF